jgi:hypothetical protein
MKKASARTRKPAKAAPEKMAAVTPSAPAVPRQWGLIGALLAVSIAITAGVAMLFGVPGSSPDPATERMVINNYIDLVCSEVLDKLAAANDGDLTGEQAMHVIKVSIPIIQEQTWQPLTDRLTSLQTEGVFDQKKLQAAIDETRKGLQSCKR